MSSRVARSERVGYPTKVFGMAVIDALPGTLPGLLTDATSTSKPQPACRSQVQRAVFYGADEPAPSQRELCQPYAARLWGMAQIEHVEGEPPPCFP